MKKLILALVFCFVLVLGFGLVLVVGLFGFRQARVVRYSNVPTMQSMPVMPAVPTLVAPLPNMPPLADFAQMQSADQIRQVIKTQKAELQQAIAQSHTAIAEAVAHNNMESAEQLRQVVNTQQEMLAQAVQNSNAALAQVTRHGNHYGNQYYYHTNNPAVGMPWLLFPIVLIPLALFAALLLFIGVRLRRRWRSALPPAQDVAEVAGSVTGMAQRVANLEEILLNNRPHQRPTQA